MPHLFRFFYWLDLSLTEQAGFGRGEPRSKRRRIDRLHRDLSVCNAQSRPSRRAQLIEIRMPFKCPLLHFGWELREACMIMVPVPLHARYSKSRHDCEVLLQCNRTGDAQILAGHQEMAPRFNASLRNKRKVQESFDHAL